MVNEKPAGQTSEGVTVLSTHPVTGLEQRADPPACVGGFWGWSGPTCDSPTVAVAGVDDVAGRLTRWQLNAAVKGNRSSKCGNDGENKIPQANEYQAEGTLEVWVGGRVQRLNENVDNLCDSHQQE